MTLVVRPAADEDADAIRAVLLAAFPSAAEADLVEQLAADGDLALSFVAAVDGKLVGHIAFSRMTATADGDGIPALGLAPVAVAPSHQKRGIAGRLIERGLAAANGRGAAIVFVVGDPDYYGRLGFRCESAAPFASPYAGPHFMAQWLSSPRAPASGQADYAPAFGRL
ncbi:N-acetyltransferase [Sphingosinicella sp. YJ22]|uniref:GNAT family N-acetyltransferase n=1 Tax=Sphingosinicella sp. YJ22 TaxID=1104780 RepID=UPI0014098B89|nr:N-acetyltransferase [Sphingosinicella sp. YJ22]